MRSFICLGFLLITSLLSAQTTLRFKIKDKLTKEPLLFCTVAVLGTNKGGLTNEDGEIQLKEIRSKDTLKISYTGYEVLKTTVAEVAKTAVVYLAPAENNLAEVEIHSSDGYLYAMMLDCAKALTKTSKYQSKVYMELETDIENQPVEILECYYNGQFNGPLIKELNYKTGRVGLAPKDDHYFVSLNTSKAISFLNILDDNEKMPVVPLQLSKRKMRKAYALNLISITGRENPIYQISFTPRDTNGNYFGGEIWIDQKTSALAKITLKTENASRYPFIPIFPDATIHDVGMEITLSFGSDASANQLDHIDFAYHLNYKGVGSDNHIVTQGIIYLYDFEKPFFTPCYEIDPDQTDYRKISNFPENTEFWKHSNNLIFTEKQQKKLNFFAENGILRNFKVQINGRKGFFEHENLFWTDTARLFFKKEFMEKLKGIPKSSIEGYPGFESDRYHLDVQIFLDINEVGDSLTHFSLTIFDVFRTYFKIPVTEKTNAFVNMYFDVCEISRRDMEAEMRKKSQDLDYLKKCYEDTQKSLQLTSNQYFKEVNLGQNDKAMEKWNTYIKDHLGVDNKELLKGKQ